MLINEVFLKQADLAGRADMESLCISGEQRIQRTVIGKSILGREIPAYLIGEGKRSALYVGTHHALESIGANLLYLMLFTLVRERKFKALECGVERGALLRIFRFVIIPCLNPDGVELRLCGADSSPLRERQIRMSGGDFSFWQANARGVDLNHNYDARFREYKKIEAERGISAGATLYSGEYPESEPEAKALAGVLRALHPTLSVSLHTQGEEIYFSAKAKRLARYLSKATGYEPKSAEDTAAYGGMTDYLDRLGLAALTVEMGKGKNPLPESALPAIAERLLAPLIALPTMI